MATIDDLSTSIQTLDFAALKRLSEQVNTRIAEKREGELKTLVDGWAKKALHNGLTIAEVIEELKKYLPKKDAKASATKEGGRPYKMGATYKNPNGTETWIGGTKGHQPPWLKEAAPTSMDPAERARKFEEMEVK